MSSKRDIQISKALSYLLRHGAQKEKLQMDTNGFIKLTDILTHNRLKTHHTTREDIIRIVEENNKKRFVLKKMPDLNTDSAVLIEYIAATQGHSIKLTPTDEMLTKIETNEILSHPLIHGTNLKNLNLIIESGFISRMQRNHIHLSPGVVGEDSNVISGMRVKSTVLIFLRADKLIETGNLYKSKNNVFLISDNITLDCFDHIELRNIAKIDHNLAELLNTHQIKYTLAAAK